MLTSRLVVAFTDVSAASANHHRFDGHGFQKSIGYLRAGVSTTAARAAGVGVHLKLLKSSKSFFSCVTLRTHTKT